MLERQPKPQSQTEPKRFTHVREYAGKKLGTAGLYFDALVTVPSLLLASLRIRNPMGLDFELKTLEEGSFHDAFVDPETKEGYIPAGANVSITGLERPVLIKDSKRWADIYVGSEGQKITLERGDDGRERFYLDPSENTNLDNLQRFAPIGDTGLEAEFIRESRSEVNSHYPARRGS